MIYIDHEETMDPYLDSTSSSIMTIWGGHAATLYRAEGGQSNPAFIERSLDLQRFGYGVEGRPVFLRAFYSRRENLLIVEDFWQPRNLRTCARISVSMSSLGTTRRRSLQRIPVSTLRNPGMHGVEFYYDDRNLLSKMRTHVPWGLA